MPISNIIPERYEAFYAQVCQTWFDTAKVTAGRDLTGGHSGAAVLLIDVAPQNTLAADRQEALSGNYVLKLDTPQWRDSEPSTEIQKHQTAFSWNPAFSNEHLLKMLYSIEIDGHIALLYDVAGLSTVTVAAADTLDAGFLNKSINTLSRSLLTELNPAPKTNQGMLPSDIMAALLGYRLDPTKATGLHALSAEYAGLQPTFPVWDEVLVNPLWFCTSSIAKQEPLVVTLTGLLHGDLHLRNLLVDRLETSGQRYWLIDFALSFEGPLGYDHAYFELSFLLKQLGHLSQERMLGVLRDLDYPANSSKAHSLPVEDVGIVTCIRGMRECISTWQQNTQPRRRDIVESQLLLTRIAAGLNWASKPIGEPSQRHALIYAAWAARTYVKKFHPEQWKSILSQTLQPTLHASVAPAAIRSSVNEEETWTKGWESLGKLGVPNAKYILVAGSLGTHENNPSLGMVPWSAILDFDPSSTESGLYSTASPVLSKSRAISQFGRDIRPVNYALGTAWMMSYGWLRINETVPDSFRQWRKTYISCIRELSENIRTATSPQRVYIVFLPGGYLTGNVLDRTIEECDEVFGDTAQITVVGTDSISDESILHSRIPLTPQIFIKHLRGLYGSTDNPDACTIPGPDGQRTIPIEILRHLEQDIEILHSRILTTLIPDITTDSFWRGSPPSWHDIHAGTDVVRSIHSDLLSTTKGALEQYRNLTIELHHSPGAGGTTAAMRVAWELRTLFPVAFLRNNSTLLVDRLRDLSHISQHPILLVIDGSVMNKTTREELYQSLSANNTRVVILHVMRTLAEDTGRRLRLYDPMSRSESRLFLESFRLRPEIQRDSSKYHLLTKIAISQDKSPLIKYRSPFFFGLATYGTNFTSISSYVTGYLSALPNVMREPMLYLALVSRFSQLDMTVSLMAALSGIDATSDNAAFESALKESAALVVRRGSDVKLLHPIIADEVLRQLMGKRPSQQWGYELADLAIRFIDALIARVGTDSDVVKNILVETFISRDIWPRDGVHVRNFSEFIEAISDTHSQHRVLKHLTETLPYEAHFWNHLGRHHIYKLSHDYETAERYLIKAVELSNDDSNHHHSLGMVRRFWILYKLRRIQHKKGQSHSAITTEDLLRSINELADHAFESFAMARTLNPGDDHGYITHIQLILEIIEALISNSGATSIGRIQHADGDVGGWLREHIAIAEQLLAQVQHLRPESKPSRYETVCLSKLAKIWGNYTEVIDNWEKLIDKDDDNIFIRRALATAYYASNKREWSNIPAPQLQRISDLMSINLREDPSNENDLRTWFEANRRLSGFSYMDALSKLNGWAGVSDALDAWYNIYILHFLQFRAGIETSEDEILNALRHCKEKAEGRRGYSYHWLGKFPEWCPIVHFSELGVWNDEDNFYPKRDLLARVYGTIKVINGPQSGKIRLGAHTEAFFVPGKQFFASHDINAEVEFYLGFSYEGFRAWSVTRPNNSTGLTSGKI